MSYNTIFSPLNSLTFVPLGRNDIFIGKDWLKNRLAYNTHNRSVKYKQPVNLADPQCIQLQLSTLPDAITFTIYSCDGDNLEDIDISYSVEDVYNTYNEQGDIVYYITVQYDFRFVTTFSANTEGIYYCQISIEHGDATEAYITEALDVRTAHGGTMLLEYTSDVNSLETIFESFTTQFARRFPCKIEDFTPEREEIDFTTEAQKLIKVASYPYDITTLRFDNIADFDIQKLNYILACKRFKINSNVYVSNENIEKERSGTNPLYKNVRVELRDYNLMQSYSYKTGISIPLFGVMTYPFFIFDLYITDGYRNIYLNNEYKLIEDAGVLSDHIDYLNDILAPQQGLEGTFENVSGIVKYNNGTDENYTLGYALVNNQHLDFEITTYADDQQWKIELREFIFGIDWGDGTPAVYGGDASSNPVYISNTYVYATAGTYTVRVFHTPNYSGVGAPTGSGVAISPPTDPRGGNGATLTGVGGNSAPTNLKQYLMNWGELGSIDITFLQGAYLHIETVVISESEVTAITGLDLPGTLKWGLGFRWVDFTRNELTVSSVNTILVNLNSDLQGFGSFAGTISTKFQTPAAAPTGTGATAKTALINKGWTVNTD